MTCHQLRIGKGLTSWVLGDKASLFRQTCQLSPKLPEGSEPETEVGLGSAHPLLSVLLSRLATFLDSLRVWGWWATFSQGFLQEEEAELCIVE